MSYKNFLTINAATRSGTMHRPSQDWYAFLPGVAVVLDGASDPLETRDRDGGWYAAELGSEILRALHIPPDAVPLPLVLEQAIAEIARRYSLVCGRAPSSTVLIARTTQDTLELLVLGDSTAAVLTAAGEHTYSDTRLALVAPELRQSYQEGLRQGHGFGTEHQKILSELVAAQRKHRNREGGYWIAEADPEAAHRAITTTVPVTAVETLVLATDGAANAVERYGLFDGWRSLARVAAEKGTATVIEQIVEVEHADDGGRSWPRAKRSDDKTLAVMDMSCES